MLRKPEWSGQARHLQTGQLGLSQEPQNWNHWGPWGRGDPTSGQTVLLVRRQVRESGQFTWRLTLYASTSHCLSFLSCKMGLMVEFTSQSCSEG